MICTKCNEDKTAIDNGKRRTRGDGIVYQDDTGRCWTYKTCPDCRYGETSKRSTKREASEPIRLTARPCTICAKFLPEGRRYYHEDCLKNVDYHNWSDDYTHHVTGRR